LGNQEEREEKRREEGVVRGSRRGRSSRVYIRTGKGRCQLCRKTGTY